jgi:hypothetical protein
MATYQLKWLDHNDTVIREGTLNAWDDHEARRNAEGRLSSATALEIWRGSRCIGRLPTTDAAAFRAGFRPHHSEPWRHM